MPYPHRYVTRGDFGVYSWLIKGYFGSKASCEYYNDIVARFVLSFDYGIDLSFEAKRTYCDDKPLELEAFGNLKSLKNTHPHYEANTDLVCVDEIFWALKLKFEALIRIGRYDYEGLENFAFDNFKDRAKDHSTLRAKCRNIWNWYYERDFEITNYTRKTKTLEELNMTRTEHMRKVNANKKLKARRLIESVITGLYADEYKLPNGSWNKSKIAKDTGLGVSTIRRHFNKYQTIKN